MQKVALLSHSYPRQVSSIYSHGFFNYFATLRDSYMMVLLTICEHPAVDINEYSQEISNNSSATSLVIFCPHFAALLWFKSTGGLDPPLFPLQLKLSKALD